MRWSLARHRQTICRRSLDTGTPSAVPPPPPPSPGFWGERDAYKDVNPGAWTSGGQLLLCLECLGRACGLQPTLAAMTGLGFGAVLLRVLFSHCVCLRRLGRQVGAGFRQQQQSAHDRLCGGAPVAHQLGRVSGCAQGCTYAPWGGSQGEVWSCRAGLRRLLHMPPCTSPLCSRPGHLAVRTTTPSRACGLMPT